MANNKELLKKASECIFSLQEKNDSLTKEINEKTQKLAHYEKIEKAGAIADILISKGAIVSSQKQEKVAELMNHDNLDEVEALVGLVTPSGTSSLGEIVQLNQKTASSRTIDPYEEIALNALEKVGR